MKEDIQATHAQEDVMKTVMITRDEELADVILTIRLDEFSDKILTGVSSNIGRRKYQQDATKVCIENKNLDAVKAMAILCDGMGGLHGGEIASNLCVDKMNEFFYEADQLKDIPYFFLSSISRLDRLVSELADDNQNPIHAGTTLASVVIFDNNLFWASVGDSRIYLIRDNEIVQITEDHNYMLLLKQRIKRGLMTQQEADEHPKREALISYIGMGGVEYIDYNKRPLHLLNNDIVLICSDGLFRSLSDEEMLEETMLHSEDMNIAAQKLTEKAVGKGKKNQDNTAVVLLKYTE